MAKSQRVRLSNIASPISNIITDTYINAPKFILIQNKSATDSFWIGGQDVTVDNGYEVRALKQASFDLYPRDVLYGITESNDVFVSVLWLGHS